MKTKEEIQAQIDIIHKRVSFDEGLIEELELELIKAKSFKELYNDSILPKYIRIINDNNRMYKQNTIYKVKGVLEEDNNYYECYFDDCLINVDIKHTIKSNKAEFVAYQRGFYLFDKTWNKYTHEYIGVITQFELDGNDIIAVYGNNPKIDGKDDYAYLQKITNKPEYLVVTDNKGNSTINTNYVYHKNELVCFTSSEYTRIANKKEIQLYKLVGKPCDVSILK